MSAVPDALQRFWNEFSAAEPQARMGGIYANKSGYHNTRANHLRDRPGDYSIQRAADKQGPSDKASAIDITFADAQRSDFRTIAKYSKRLYDAGVRRDKRFYAEDGQTAIVREFFGNTDADRTVEGWSYYREAAASSDSSHLWHIHLSVTRKYCNDWSKLKPILDVMLGRDSDAPAPTPEPPKDWFDLATKADLQDVVRDELKFLREIGSLREQNADGTRKVVHAGYLMAHVDRNSFDNKAILQQRVLPELAEAEARDVAEATAVAAIREAITELGVSLTAEQVDALAQAVVRRLVGEVSA